MSKTAARVPIAVSSQCLGCRRSVGITRANLLQPGSTRRRCNEAGARRAVTAPRASWSPFVSSFPSDDGPRMKSIFQPEFIPATNAPPTHLDARDALETCGHLHGEARQACFALFNCEPSQVETFYPIVSQLEGSLLLETEPEEEATHKGSER